MTTTNNVTKYIVFTGFVFALVFGVVSAVPIPAHACIKALGFLDPFCVVDGNISSPDLPALPELPNLPSLNGWDSNTDPQIVNNTYNNSNNVNSNVNSPNASVGGLQPIAYNYNTTPIYNYDYYPDYNHYNQDPLRVSCYPMSLSTNTGNRMTWYASAYGGNGSYHYSWTGTDGLSGTGQSISKTYYSSGYKNASITVISGGQTVSSNCDGSVDVRGDYYRDNNPYPYYPSSYNYYTPVSVICRANTNYVNTGVSVSWSAYPSGGNGSYSYSWSGTDGLYGSSQTAYRSYTTPGTKYATVTVYSNGQSITQSCGSMNVAGYYGSNVVYIPTQDNNNSLDIACYSDPRTVTVDQPATWTTEVTGGVAPYTYIWTGTDDLAGNTGSVIKYYSSPGNKTAVITVKSADGRSESRACSTSITVKSYSTGGTTITPAPVPQEDTDNGLSAAALFSLKNVPWGWVAILVILVLFGTIVYLIYNRPKI